MQTKGKILIVEDEFDIVEFLQYNLEKEGYDIEKAYDGDEGWVKARRFKPHLILLDIMMPKMDGIELCDKLRADREFDKTLIAFLTARSESFTHITALDKGGDDFITKPIKPNILKSRINALMRRHPGLLGNERDRMLKFGDLSIDKEAYAVQRAGKDVSLAKKEFDLLLLLVSKPGKVFRREEILNKVWGNDVIVGDRTIDVHIRKIREKLGSHYIQTMKGVGYKFDF